MINAVTTSITNSEGDDRNIIIEPVLEKAGEHGLAETGVYKIYKDAFGDETQIFTEPNDFAENDDLPDEQNPDYLGTVILNENGDYTFQSDLFTPDERRAIIEFIKTYEEPEVNY
jgi:hypothetical protein